LTIQADDVIVTIRLDIDLDSAGRVDTRTYGPGEGGDLIITASNSVLVTDTGLILADTLGTDPNAGAGGNIIITAPRIEVLSGWIDASTYGPGQGGSVMLNASEAITLDFFGTVVSQTLGTDPSAGAGGHVSLEAPIINVRRGSRIGADSAGPGQAGDVTLMGTEQVNIFGIGTAYIYSGDSSYPIFEYGSRYVIEGTTSKSWPWRHELPPDTTVTIEQLPARIHTHSAGSGSGGDVTIRTPQLLLSDKAFITAENTGDGAAGNVLLQVGSLTTEAGATILSSTTGAGAAGSIHLQGLGGTGTFPTDVTMTDSFVSTSASGTGAGGNILIGAGGSTPLTLTNTTISASVHDVPQGAAPDQGVAHLTVTGPTIRITGGRLIADTTGTRQGGDILIRADQNAHLTQANVSVKSTGPASAGNILIEGGQTVQLQHTHASAEAAQASGGNIKLIANDTIRLVDSTIASSVQGDATTVGGNITLDPDFIVLQNSQILAKAVAGKGGNIRLMANQAVLMDSQSMLDAASQTGISGSVAIASPIQVLSGTIAPLPITPVNVATLYSDRCVAGKGGRYSTFVDSKADSVAPTPGTFLASPFLPLSSSYQAMTVGDTGAPSGVSETTHSAPLQVAAYSPPLFSSLRIMESFLPAIRRLRFKKHLGLGFNWRGITDGHVPTLLTSLVSMEFPVDSDPPSSSQAINASLEPKRKACFLTGVGFLS
jgi:large exoprotein involved in heme utilization and adhesion